MRRMLVIAAVAGFLDRVRAATDVAEADLVGHSQGGLIAEYSRRRVPAGCTPWRCSPR